MPSSFSNAWDSSLLDRALLSESLDRLLEKRFASRAKHALEDPIHPELDLGWLVKHRKKFLNALIQNLSLGHHEFQPSKKITAMVDKKRELFVSSWPDRLVISRLAEVLGQRLDPLLSPHLYSFRKNRGSALATGTLVEIFKTHQNDRLFFLKRDISSYGEAIQQDLLIQMLEKVPLLKESRVFFPLLKKAIRVRYFSQVGSDRSGLSLLEAGLPAGSPVVPVLENFYLDGLDRELEVLNALVFYGRYGDDFLIITTGIESVQKASQIIDDFCENLQLKMKPEKKLNGAWRGEAIDFPRRESLDWLGIRFFSDATIGIRLLRMKELRNSLKDAIFGASYGVATLDLEPEQKQRLIETRLQFILREDFHPTLERLFREIRNPKLLKDLDHEAVGWIVKSLQKNLKCRKKTAWSEFKKMKLPLLHRQWVTHGVA